MSGNDHRLSFLYVPSVCVFVLMPTAFKNFLVRPQSFCLKVNVFYLLSSLITDIVPKI